MIDLCLIHYSCLNMKQNYEIYLVLNPELTAEQVDTEVSALTTQLTSNLEAADLVVNKQGLLRLAYPIQKHLSGFYVLINFDLEFPHTSKLSEVERKLNLQDSVIRYIIVNQTEYNKAKAKEKKNEKAEFTSHRDLNKGKSAKKDISKYLGLEAIDYKDAEFLNQFTSPYAKIFNRDRTGSSAKFQRKITTAIKRARHMALMPFTAKYMS